PATMDHDRPVLGGGSMGEIVTIAVIDDQDVVLTGAHDAPLAGRPHPWRSRLHRSSWSAGPVRSLTSRSSYSSVPISARAYRSARIARARSRPFWPGRPGS